MAAQLPAIRLDPFGLPLRSQLNQNQANQARQKMAEDEQKQLEALNAQMFALHSQQDTYKQRVADLETENAALLLEVQRHRDSIAHLERRVVHNRVKIQQFQPKIEQQGKQLELYDKEFMDLIKQREIRAARLK